MTAATSLKAIVFLHTYISLSFVETFFIDWERPRLTSVVSVNNITSDYNEIRSSEPTIFEISSKELPANESTKNLSKKTQYNPIVIW